MAIRGIETGPNALRRAVECHAEASSAASPDAVWRALADLRQHLEWAGARRSPKMRLLTMDAPEGFAAPGTEFSTTGSDPGGTFADRSVVTEASPGRVFEFVTEAVLTPKGGGEPVAWTIVHRYEIAPAPAGGSTISYRFRITRISRLMGPLRLFRSPLGGLLRKAWSALARKGLRHLASFAAGEA